MVRARVERGGHAVAVLFDGGSLSYAELDARANRLARLLLRRGAGEGRTVALLLPRSVDLIVAELAVLKAGSALFPIDPAYPACRIAFMLRDTDRVLVLSRSDQAMCGEEASVVALDDPTVIAELVGTSSFPLTAEDRPDALRPEQPAYLTYTFGSAGHPVGVPVSHGSLVGRVVAELDRWEVVEGDRLLQFSSPSVDASILELGMALSAGAALVVPPSWPLLGDALADVLAGSAITHVLIPSTALATVPVVPLPKLRTLLIDGDDCPAELVSRWARSRRVITAGGPTADRAQPVAADLDDGPDSGAMAGPAPLTPMQHRLLADGVTDGRSVMCVELDLRDGVDVDMLATAIEAVTDHHEALRLRFRELDGTWCQEPVPRDGTVLTRVDLSATAEKARLSVAEAHAMAARSSMHLADGPLFRALIFERGGAPDRLLLAAHHVVVDGVSWRILLADLASAYQQLMAGSAVRLPEVSTGYRDWARRLAEYVDLGGFAEELPYWRAATEDVPVDLPVDRQGCGVVGSTRVVSGRLDRASTDILLNWASSAGRTRTVDLLLAALSRVLANWTGRRGLLIGLEGHCREEVLPGVDPSTTVGRFTTGFPLALRLPAGPDNGFDWASTIKSVKEQLRAVPGSGIGYAALRHLSAPDTPAAALRGTPEPRIRFAYRGQWDIGPGESDLFGARRTPVGRDLAAEDGGSPLLDVIGQIKDGRLELNWWYSAGVYDEATIARLSGELIDGVRQLVEQGAAPGAGATRPSDFPLVGLSQATIDRIVAEGGEIEDIYPLTSAQAGMLFHGLGESEVSTCLDQATLRLSGVVDAMVLAAAWARVVERTPVLRSCLLWHSVGAPVHVVRRAVALPVEHHDWRSLTEPDRAAALTALLTADRAAGFDLTAAPLLRLSIARRADDEVVLVLSFPPLLLDGWSLTQVVAEVAECYAALIAARPPNLITRRPFREHLAWLAEQSGSAAEGYWRNVLAGFCRPTPLPFDRIPERTHRNESPEILRIALSPRQSDRVRRMAQRHGLTVDAIVSGAWALLLSWHGNERDVLFGTAVSDRPAQLAGAESMIGMFVNYVPARVTIEPTETVLSWLHRLQAALDESRAFQFTPLARLRSYSDLGPATSLFDSIVAFEQHPLGGVSAFGGGIEDGPRVREARMVNATAFPLCLRAHLAERLHLALSYDPTLFDRVTVERLTEALRLLLVAVTTEPQQRLGDLPWMSEVDSERPAARSSEAAHPGCAGYQPPRTAAEHEIVQIFAEVLGVDRVGRLDGFFELGGDSAACIGVVARLRAALGVTISPRALFATPTVAGLAAGLAEELAEELVEPAGAPVPAVACTESMSSAAQQQLWFLQDFERGAVERRAPIPASTRSGPVPLSFAQQRLWFLHEFEPGDVEHLVPITLRLHGPLHVPKLKRTLTALLARHEALRTSFPTVQGRPMQVVEPAGEVDLKVVDLSGLRWAEAELDRLLVADLATGFDLSHGPLLRATLIRMDHRDHVLSLMMHRIVADDWSGGVIIDELDDGYRSELNYRAAELPQLPVRYSDFAAWQRERCSGPASRADLAYWRSQLAGCPPLELPTDRPRPSVRTSRGALVDFVLSAEITARLRTLAANRGGTLFTALIAGCQVLLSRWSGQDDVAVGTVVSGRNRPETTGLVGLFANTLVLRGRVPFHDSFAKFVGRTQETLLGALEHQDLPFERLVELLATERDPSRTPLFQAAVELKNTPHAQLGLSGLLVEEVRLPVTTASVDVLFQFQEIGEGLQAELKYNTDLFDAATAERLAGQLRVLLAGAAANPHRPVADLPLVTAQQRELLLGGWSGVDGAAGASAESIVRVFGQVRDIVPHAVAVASGPRSLTYGELDAQANQLAHRLIVLGVRPEDRVGILLGRSVDVVVAALGALKAGAAYVPLDPGAPAEELRGLLAAVGAGVLLTDRESDAVAESVHDGRRVLLDDGARSGLPTTQPRIQVHPDQLAYVLPTSGRPVAVCHRGVVALALDDCFAGSGADRMLMHAPLGCYASIIEMWVPLLQGGCVVVAPPADLTARSLPTIIADERVSGLVLTSGLYRAVVADAPELLAGVREVFAGQDGVPSAALHRILAACPDTTVFSFYGAAESTALVAVHPMGSPDRTGEVAALGRPLVGTRIFVLDRHVRPVPDGAVGELYVVGDGVARGYLGRPEATAERFVACPFVPGERMYRTGDLVRWSSGGLLEFVGPADGQVTIRGFQVKSWEVEAALLRHAAVAEAVVTVVGTGDRARLAAYLRPTPEEALDAGVVAEFVKTTLPGQLVPDTFTILDTFPLDANGKVDRERLPIPDDQTTAAPERLLPRTPVEVALAEIWRQVLDIEEIGVTDNFFELGGDSIRSVHLIALARDAGFAVEVKDMFLRPTIAELATFAGSPGERTDHRSVVSGPVGLTPMQHWLLANRATPEQLDRSMLVELAPTVDEAALRVALVELVVHHDALRMRFHRVDGLWRQHNAPSEPADPLCRHDLSGLDEQDQRLAMETIVLSTQSGVDLGTGPQLRAVLFTLGGEQPPRLFLAIHQLVVDATSWQILIADLDIAYHQAVTEQPIDLGRKTTSFRTWARRLTRHVGNGSFDHELGHWNGVETDYMLPAPDGRPGNKGMAVLEANLSEDVTDVLLHRAPGTYLAGVNDLLLTGFALALCQWTDRRRVVLDLEGDAREETFDDVDLSRTIGAFVTVFPVTLHVNEDLEPDPTRLIQSIRRQLGQVPGTGLGYGALRYLGSPGTPGHRLADRPAAQVMFRNLGQRCGLGETEPDTGLCRAVRPGFGYDENPNDRGAHVIEVTAEVRTGRLTFACRYSSDHYRDTTVARLIGNFAYTLTRIAFPGQGTAAQ
jgi:amino acid adenylation domain-containing protein/non-ribosomal peptide synthase protein (TIGR01720 family)